MFFSQTNWVSKNNSGFWSFSLAGMPIFTFIKEILKNTRENTPSDHFSSNFLQEGPINVTAHQSYCWNLGYNWKDTNFCYRVKSKKIWKREKDLKNKLFWGEHVMVQKLLILIKIILWCPSNAPSKVCNQINNPESFDFESGKP